MASEIRTEDCARSRAGASVTFGPLRVCLFWQRRCRREQVVFQNGQPEQHEKRHRRAEQGYHDHGASPGSRPSRLMLDGKPAKFTVRPNGGGRTRGRGPHGPNG